MPRLLPTALVVSTLALVPLARADDGGKPTPEGAPKPAPALVDAFKGMTGTWACKGKAPKMDGSGMLDTKSTMVLKSTLGGFAYSGDVTVEKNAMLPEALKVQLYWSYNSATNKLVEFFADSFGGLGHGTSEGLTGDTLVWDEDVVMMAKANKAKTTVKRNGPKEIALTFDMQTDGKWTTLGTNSCKKQ
jgi:hypothetical protein